MSDDFKFAMAFVALGFVGGAIAVAVPLNESRGNYRDMWIEEKKENRAQVEACCRARGGKMLEGRCLKSWEELK